MLLVRRPERLDLFRQSSLNLGFGLGGASVRGVLLSAISDVTSMVAPQIRNMWEG